MNELALFAGSGGGILGSHLLGWRTICAVEIDNYCVRRLMQRQSERHLPPFPIWNDVRTFDGYPWRGVVDVVSGGFPCQNISSYGDRYGLEGNRSSLWFQMARVISEVQPLYVFVENSPLLRVRGLKRVVCDLAKMGYDARWGIIGAHNLGAPHERDRIFIVSYPHGLDMERMDLQRRLPENLFPSKEALRARAYEWRSSLPRIVREHVGMAYRVERTRAIGNGIVPAVAKMAFQII